MVWGGNDGVRCGVAMMECGGVWGGNDCVGCGKDGVWCGNDCVWCGVAMMV